MVVPAEPDAEDRAAVADIVEAGPLMRDMERVVDRQHDDRGAEADLGGDCRRIGQHHHRVEAEDVVERIFGHPEIAEPERLGALCDPAHRLDIDRLGRAVRQSGANRDFVFQSHAARPSFPQGWSAGSYAADHAFENQQKFYGRATFSISSIWAPSGASRKQTRRPLLGGSSSRMRTPFSRSLAIAPE